MRIPIKFPKNRPLGFWIHPADSTGQGQPGVCQGHLEVPWECQIGPKLKIYVKIIYCEHFLFFENFWLLVIFGTLFSEKCQFLGNFDKNLFLPPLSTKITKKCSKFNLELFVEHFLSICLMMGAKTGFCQNCPKIDIFDYTKFQKSLTAKNFQKTENTHNI